MFWSSTGLAGYCEMVAMPNQVPTAADPGVLMTPREPILFFAVLLSVVFVVFFGCGVLKREMSQLQVSKSSSVPVDWTNPL